MVAAETVASEQAEAAPAAWPLYRRILFRFACCYFLLYGLPEGGRVSLPETIPGIAWLAQKYINLWHAINPWVAIHIFHLNGKATTYFPTGSGDTTLDYIENLCYLVLAAAAALVWSLADRKRPDYRRLHGWLRLWVRYTLAFTMFAYGFAKIFPLQFQPAPFFLMTEPWGDSSPMGALWKFMGASQAYTVFAGASEAIGGLLLLTRRTATLGALVCFGVLSNVVALNFCYDVPVKLYSSNLLLMAAFLLMPEMRRLARFLILNRAAEPADWSAPRFESRRWRLAAAAFQVLFVGYALYDQIHGGLQGYQEVYVHPQRPPLYGLYEVESFVRNGRETPPLITEAGRWRKVMIDSPAGVAVRMTDDSLARYGAKYDALKHIVTLSGRAAGSFTYTRVDLDHLIMEGTLDGATLSMRLRRIDPSRFLLLSRGFHWINEVPFNR